MTTAVSTNHGASGWRAEDRHPSVSGGAPRMRIAVLAKQVPRSESLELLANGRLRRDGVELEMNPYCRRAVAKGIELATESGGCCVVYSVGPPAADDVLREAVAAGAGSGVLLCDPVLAGSDTLATAGALAAILRRDGPWDLVLAGQSSIDADTGQVGPQVAELLDLPFVGAVRELHVCGDAAYVRGELDDGWVSATVLLPAVLSVAERITSPCKMPPAARAAVAADRIRRVSASDLGPGPWGIAGSRTRVGETRLVPVERLGLRLTGTVEEQAAQAAAVLMARGLVAPGGWGMPALGAAAPDLAAGAEVKDGPLAGSNRGAEPEFPAHAVAGGAGRAKLLVVVVEPGRRDVARELTGEAARIAREVDAAVVAVGPELPGGPEMAAWGAHRAVQITGTGSEEDVSEALAWWCLANAPWAVLGPSTVWGRQVLSRLAARCQAGLTGDAVSLSVCQDRLICWKPAFGGRTVVAVTATSDLQLATIRPGVMPVRRLAAPAATVSVEALSGRTRSRVMRTAEERDARSAALVAARCVVCVGLGVAPDDYAVLDPLVAVLGAELGATRRVTDRGWLPRSRQVGITGHSVAPTLYIGIGLSGKFNHMIGVRRAGTIVVVNDDPGAPVFEWADVGLVGDWRLVVPALAHALAAAVDGAAAVEATGGSAPSIPRGAVSRS